MFAADTWQQIEVLRGSWSCIDHHYDGTNVNTGIFVSVPWAIRKFRMYLDFLIAQGTETSSLHLHTIHTISILNNMVMTIIHTYTHTY